MFGEEAATPQQPFPEPQMTLPNMSLFGAGGGTNGHGAVAGGAQGLTLVHLSAQPMAV